METLGEEERDNLEEEAAITQEEEGDKRNREEGDSHRHHRRCHVGECRHEVAADDALKEVLDNLDNIDHRSYEEAIYRVLELAEWLTHRLGKAVPVERKELVYLVGNKRNKEHAKTTNHNPHEHQRDARC